MLHLTLRIRSLNSELSSVGFPVKSHPPFYFSTKMLKIFPTTLFLHNIKGYFSLIRNWSFDLLFAFGHWIKCQIGICWRVQPVDHKVRWPYCAELTVSHLTQVESTMLSCDLFLFLPSGPGKWELAPTIRPQFWKQDGKSELVFVENVNCWINNNYREDPRQTLSCHRWFAPPTPDFF